jgi:hypothetical protein
MSDMRNPVEGIEHERPERFLRPPRLRYAVGAWLAMVGLAILNATARELFVVPAVGDYWAHVISTGTLLVALVVLVAVYFVLVPEHTPDERRAVGVLWAGLTVAFELLFGHYVAGDSWASLLAQYDVTAGRVWVLVPLFLLVAPIVFGRYLGRWSSNVR